MEQFTSKLPFLKIENRGEKISPLHHLIFEGGKMLYT